MGLIAMIVLGAIAGWLASMVTSSSNGILMDIILGVVGSFVGGLIMNMLGQPGLSGFNLYSLIVSFIGAVVLILVGRVLTGDRRRVI